MGTISSVWHVTLGYGDVSVELVNKLVAETDERRKDSGWKMSTPAIGPCIRRVRVAGYPSNELSPLRGLQRDDGTFRTPNRQERLRRWGSGLEEAFDAYTRRFQVVFNYRTTPHWELMDWDDSMILHHDYFNFLALSPVKHLKLFRIKVETEFAIELPDAFRSYSWPLQTLDLDIMSVYRSGRHISVSPITTSILRWCAPTLVNLTLRGIMRGDPCTFLGPDNKGVPNFPRLRFLNLGSIRLEDPSILEALISDSLRILCVGQERDCEVRRRFLRQRGCLANLEQLVCDSSPVPADHPLDFFCANPQIVKLAVQAWPSSLLEVKLLPILSQHFSKLRVLSLIWERRQLSESALQAVASIRTLERLHISCGN